MYKQINGVCDMYEDLVKQNIIVELKELVDNVESFDNDLDSYCDFMRQVILNTTGIN